MIPQDETNLRTNMLLTPPTLARYTVGLLIAVAVAFLMWYFRSIVVYILVSALLAIIFNPLVGRLAAVQAGLPSDLQPCPLLLLTRRPGGKRPAGWSC